MNFLYSEQTAGLYIERSVNSSRSSTSNHFTYSPFLKSNIFFLHVIFNNPLFSLLQQQRNVANQRRPVGVIGIIRIIRIARVIGICIRWVRRRLDVEIRDGLEHNRLGSGHDALERCIGRLLEGLRVGAFDEYLLTCFHNIIFILAF